MARPGHRPRDDRLHGAGPPAPPAAHGGDPRRPVRDGRPAGRVPGKIPKRERYPAFAIDFITHERDAESLFPYENSVIPRLLQTPEYAAAVFGCLYPPMTPEEIEVQTAGRLTRQSMLARKPWPPIWDPAEPGAVHGGRQAPAGRPAGRVMTHASRGRARPGRCPPPGVPAWCADTGRGRK
ncbi:Scr1 family TA system antitoxin-like transcriptional regulator [Streptomyces sp. NBC_00435]|uniref:Scr1 family TA system antitoxin-like transcriptional regulator n=1 Tax=Streptomyces sp. NBC_00435 TaxID=2903649 RepID=UPI003FA6A0A7